MGSLFGQAAIELFNLHSLRGMMQLWFLFVKTVRSYWAQGKILPRMPADKIDLRCCLIYQKLQMVQLLLLLHLCPTKLSFAAQLLCKTEKKSSRCGRKACS